MIEIDRDPAHDAARRELSKPIYPKGSLSQRLGEWLDEFFNRLGAHAASMPGGWFTVAVLATVLIVATVVAIRIARRAMGASGAADFPLFGSAELSAADHRATAQRYAAQGDWSTAIRHRVRAIARRLEESGVLDPVPGRTANELARDAARALGGFADELRSAAASFNDVTYGQRPGSEPEYLAITDLDERLLTPRATPAPVGQHLVADSWVQVQ